MGQRRVRAGRAGRGIIGPNRRQDHLPQRPSWRDGADPGRASFPPRQRLAGAAPHRFAEHGIARTFQTPRVFASLSASA
jgi:ABC-type uncharacterized transport system ATPase subunit